MKEVRFNDRMWFGKHKGNRICDIINHDPKFIQKLLKEDKIKLDKKITKFLEEKFNPQMTNSRSDLDQIFNPIEDTPNLRVNPNTIIKKSVCVNYIERIDIIVVLHHLLKDAFEQIMKSDIDVSSVLLNRLISDVKNELYKKLKIYMDDAININGEYVFEFIFKIHYVVRYFQIIGHSSGIIDCWLSLRLSISAFGTTTVASAV